MTPSWVGATRRTTKSLRAASSNSASPIRSISIDCNCGCCFHAAVAAASLRWPTPTQLDFACCEICGRAGSPRKVQGRGCHQTHSDLSCCAPGHVAAVEISAAFGVVLAWWFRWSSKINTNGRLGSSSMFLCEDSTQHLKETSEQTGVSYSLFSLLIPKTDRKSPALFLLFGFEISISFLPLRWGPNRKEKKRICG
ncbi:hypothetical protein OPV22_023082 [Ensete ventricosum]|uniref:Uncharacterized protein n=1 Tax=Ensete ventricosum TaxID=4639 RepID=A0AAV8QMP7_ENSVE|nr:hypothetical protein OPV22_023082 [Ensete ventricosum]